MTQPTIHTQLPGGLYFTPVYIHFRMSILGTVHPNMDIVKVLKAQGTRS